MVYGYQPKTIKTSKGLKLIEPKTIPQGDQMTPRHQGIQTKATEQVAKQIKEQEIPLTSQYKIGDKVWVLNPNTSKL